MTRSRARIAGVFVVLVACAAEARDPGVPDPVAGGRTQTAATTDDAGHGLAAPRPVPESDAGATTDAAVDASPAVVPAASGAAKVEIVKHGDRFELLRNGEPYHVKGACAYEYLDELAAAGANSIRTWGASWDPGVYDAAHDRGLTVCAGLWLLKPGEMDYADPGMVRAQEDALVAYVEAHKDHPAILMWGVGNEYEGTGTDPNVWRALESLVERIEAIDPDHPTITVLAALTQEKVDALEQYVPSLDALGINSYAALPLVPGFVETYGWDKAYFVTEWGQKGPWGELPATTWGSAYEPSSTEAAATYLLNYTENVAPYSDRLIGSFAYLWGVHTHLSGAPKPSVTRANWAESFLPTGEKLGIVDALTNAWTGVWPLHRVPEIVSLTSTLPDPAPGMPGGGAHVAKGSSHTATLVLAGAPSIEEVRWEVRTDIPGPLPVETPVVAGAITTSSPTSATFVAPQTAGPHRLYVYVIDTQGGAATANVPFYVD